METAGLYGKSIAPCLSGLTKKLVDMSGALREQQWLPPAHAPDCGQRECC